jgi:hypothetical protein
MTSLTSSPSILEKEAPASSPAQQAPGRRIQTLGASLFRKPRLAAYSVITPISIPLFLQAQTPRDIQDASVVLRHIDRDYLKIWLRLSIPAAFSAYLGTQLEAPLRVPWLIGTGLFILFFCWLGYHVTRRRVRTVKSLLRKGEVVHGRVIELMKSSRVPWFIVEFRDRGGNKHRAKVTYHLSPGFYGSGAPAIVMVSDTDPRHAAVIVRMQGEGECLQAFPAKRL